MPLIVTCPTCNAVVKMPDRAAGRHINCQKCSMPFAVPANTPTVPLAQVRSFQDGDQAYFVPTTMPGVPIARAPFGKRPSASSALRKWAWGLFLSAVASLAFGLPVFVIAFRNTSWFGKHDPWVDIVGFVGLLLLLLAPLLNLFALALAFCDWATSNKRWPGPLVWLTATGTFFVIVVIAKPLLGLGPWN